jgi:hypothetical protein
LIFPDQLEAAAWATGHVGLDFLQRDTRFEGEVPDLPSPSHTPVARAQPVFIIQIAYADSAQSSSLDEYFDQTEIFCCFPSPCESQRD